MKKAAATTPEIDPLEELMKERNFKFDFDMTESQAEAFKTSGLGDDESKRKLMLSLLNGGMSWDQATPRQKEWANYISRLKQGRTLPTNAGII